MEQIDIEEKIQHDAKVKADKMDSAKGYAVVWTENGRHVAEFAFLEDAELFLEAFTAKHPNFKGNLVIVVGNHMPLEVKAA